MEDLWFLLILGFPYFFLFICVKFKVSSGFNIVGSILNEILYTLNAKLYMGRTFLLNLKW
jgi:hypothetical protein